MKQEVSLNKPLYIEGLEKVPGILVLLLTGLLSKWLANYIPHIDYILVAIILGMFFSNLVGVPKILVSGINTYELWLKTGIVFLGARLALQEVFNLGVIGLVLVVLEIGLSIIVAKVLAKYFKLSDKLGSLIGIGVGICGVSAIVGAVGAIDADEDDSTYAIATILIFGAVMIFLYPLIGNLAGMSDQVFGYWAGLSVDNTAETIATGFAFSETAGKIASLTKLTRNALMGLVILIFALHYARKGMAADVEHKGRFIWERFPKFLIGFLLFSLLATAGVFSKADVSSLKALYKWMFLLAFAGVGFRTRFSEMKAGIKPFLVGLGVEGTVSIITLILVYLIAPYLPAL